MKTSTVFALLSAVAHAVPTVDETYPYTGPAIPVGDWVDPSVNGNGKGFPRLVEPPAVVPGTSNPTNNVNVIALSYIPNGINIHYQTPFGLGTAPSVKWGTTVTDLDYQATGNSHTYDRTPPCSLIAAVTQCSQFFHEVQIGGLKPGTTYYYQIPAANGTTESDVLSFTTALEAGNTQAYTAAILNDMGYTNAGGTYKYLLQAVEDGAAFAWHGGDISYADDWYSGILPCQDSWPVCYNGTSTELPGGFPIPPEYEVPLPAGEVANQGGPQGGDMSVLYESNWDLWQQWVNNITAKIPYMVLPGNHEASCSEFDGPKNILTAYLNGDISNGSAPTSALTYYSCPPSQRNFTAYQNRFRMPGAETGGVSNMWYSFDYGLVHFVSFDGETDFANSPEYPFARDLSGDETRPKENETYVTDSGPFGAVGNYSDTKTYEQYQWLAKDLASVDRTKTPWVLAMTHRPMYSSQTSSYQKYVRNAFEALLLENEVDAYLSGHIHWYERLFPLTGTGLVDNSSVINKGTYYTNPGVSMTHIINGAAGNIESHSTLSSGESVLPITNVLDYEHYGFLKLNVFNASAISFSYIHGIDGSIGDELTLLKREGSGSGGSNSTSTSSSTGPSSTSISGSGTGSGSYSVSATSGGSGGSGGAYTTTTEVVTSYTTYCPGPTTFTQGSSTYTVTQATTLTITNCPCTLTHTLPVSSVPLSSAPATSVASSGGVGAPSGSVVSSVIPGGPLAPTTSGAATGVVSSIIPGGAASSVAASSGAGSGGAATSAVSSIIPGGPVSSVAAFSGAGSSAAGSSGAVGTTPGAATSVLPTFPTTASRTSATPSSSVVLASGADRAHFGSFAGILALAVYLL